MTGFLEKSICYVVYIFIQNARRYLLLGCATLYGRNLTFNIFSRRHFDFFSVFTQNIGFNFTCSLSPKETICMKCQHLFSGKNKKNILKCRLLKLLSSMLSEVPGPRFAHLSKTGITYMQMPCNILPVLPQEPGPTLRVCFLI